MDIQEVYDYINNYSDHEEVNLAKDFFHEDVSYYPMPLVFPFNYKCVEGVGGEGQGDVYFMVYEFFDKDTKESLGFIKFDGWYASYHGAEYENMLIVKPVQKTITVYE